MVFSDKLIEDYQKNSSLTLAKACRYIAVLLVLIALLNIIGVFEIDGNGLYYVVTFSFVIALLPTIIFNVMGRFEDWAKYVVLTALVIMTGALYSVLSYHTVMIFVLPLVCACLYSEKKWIVYVGLISIPVIVGSHFLAYYLNVVSDEPLFSIHKVIYFGIIPRVIEFLAIGVICFSITRKMHFLIESLVKKNDELFENEQMLIQSLSELIEAQSQETGQHVKRVSEYTRVLCQGLGYDAEETWKISIASMMQDVLQWQMCSMHW